MAVGSVEAPNLPGRRGVKAPVVLTCVGNRHHKYVAFGKSSGDKYVTFGSVEPPNLPGRRGVKASVVSTCLAIDTTNASHLASPVETNM